MNQLTQAHSLHAFRTGWSLFLSNNSLYWSKKNLTSGYLISLLLAANSKLLNINLTFELLEFPAWNLSDKLRNSAF